ncbi:hypothetical protein [Roseovarius salinarum]|uniref:hypothetical protein n=1 Tax=Roseovarius salinarum TaxID=1981892 RepID=UPI000C32EB2E|nr:hypothetical protein [Roseovarius salinarum]
MPRTLVATVIMFLAGHAAAGPWPREEGAFFTALAGRLAVDGPGAGEDSYTTLYGEYGLTQRTTLGVDLGYGSTNTHKAVGFLRLPFERTPADTRMAYQLGVGQIDDHAVVRPGFSAGRGISLGDRAGWLTVETLGEVSLETGAIDLKADFTVGLNTGTRTKMVVQMQTGRDDGGSGYARLAPSVLFEQRPGRHIEVGVTTGIEGDDSVALKLGTWHSF